MRDWYKVRDVENDPDGNDVEDVLALDPEDAAEEWAEVRDRESADYTIVSGSPATVEVTASDGTVTRFQVTGEMVHRYDAQEVP